MCGHLGCGSCLKVWQGQFCCPPAFSLLQPPFFSPVKAMRQKNILPIKDIYLKLLPLQVISTVIHGGTIHSTGTCANPAPSSPFPTSVSNIMHLKSQQGFFVCEDSRTSPIRTTDIRLQHQRIVIRGGQP